MKNLVSRVSFLIILTLLLALLTSATAAAQDSNSIATVTVRTDVVLIQPQIKSSGYTFTVSGPGDRYSKRDRTWLESAGLRRLPKAQSSHRPAFER